MINFRRPILSTVKDPTILPIMPQNEARQLANAAFSSENPIFLSNKVPKNETDMIPENDTVEFNIKQIIRASLEFLEIKFIKKLWLICYIFKAEISFLLRYFKIDTKRNFK